jgi:hypothetical protein
MGKYKSTSPLVEIKVREDFKQIYKEKANGDDIKKMANIFHNLESMGIKVIEACGEMIKKQENWFED